MLVLARPAGGEFDQVASALHQEGHRTACVGVERTVSPLETAQLINADRLLSASNRSGFAAASTGFVTTNADVAVPATAISAAIVVMAGTGAPSAVPATHECAQLQRAHRVGPQPLGHLQSIAQQSGAPPRARFRHQHTGHMP